MLYSKTCQACSFEFNIKEKTRKFCSRSCAAKYNNKHMPKRKRKQVTKTCTSCASSFRRQKRETRCVTCVENGVYRRHTGLPAVNSQNLTLGDFVQYHQRQGHHKSLYFCEVRAYCRLRNDKLRTACQVCGYSTHVDLCHLTPLASFPLTATLGEVNAPENILVLCRNHHWELDHGIISVKEIPKRV